MNSAAHLAEELDGAVERGEIIIHFQPEVDLSDGRIASVEVLTRWQHPRLGLLMPDEFIPAAEENGLIHVIGSFVLEQGCTSVAEWRRTGVNIEVAVNVSALQLETPLFFEHLVQTLDRLLLEPDVLTLEITESQAIADLPATAARLRLLRELAVGISIDDFGTGHSSVDRLLELPVTELKIDRSLLRDDAGSGTTLVAAVVALVQDRGVRVVAEGIETQQDLEFARSLGCDRGQGYFFAPPMSKAELGLRLA